MADSLFDHVPVNAATDDDNVILIVTTAEYEDRKGPGIAAPWPGHEAVYLHPWDADTRVYWRPNNETEWEEIESPAEGETFDVRPGESIKQAAPLGLRMTM